MDMDGRTKWAIIRSGGKSEMKDSDGRESWDKLQPSLYFSQETRLLTFHLTFSKQSKETEGGEAVY